jgi:hypothetical protein
MKLRTMAGSGLAALVVVAATSSGAAIGATPVHHHHQHCPTKHGKYPPGKCQILIKHHHHHHHTSVHFRSGKVFKPGERVHETIVCTDAHVGGHHRARRLIHAHSAGRAHAGFVVHPPLRGTCTITLTGARSGVSLSTQFSV